MKQTVATLAEMKKAGRKACMVTAYDYTMARLVSAAGLDILGADVEGILKDAEERVRRAGL